MTFFRVFYGGIFGDLKKPSIMEQINKIELQGRVGNARTAKVGERTVCKFSVVTSMIYRNAEGVATEETTWHNCSIWENRRIAVLSWIRSGAMIHLTGRLRTYKYQGQDSQDHYGTEVAVSQAEQLPEGTLLTAMNMVL